MTKDRNARASTFGETKSNSDHFVGREVACQSFAFLLHEAPRHGIAADKLLVGVDYSLEHLLDVDQRIDWSTYVRIHENVERELSEEQQDVAVRRLLRLQRNRWVSPVARLLYSGVDLYSWVYGPSGRIHLSYSCLETDLHNRTDGRVDLEVRLLGDYESCPGLFRNMTAFLKILPNAIGLPDARVNVVPIEFGRHYRFEIFVSKGGGAFARLRRASMWLFSSRDMARELESMQDRMFDRYWERDAEATARQQAERALRASEERFYTVFDSSPLLTLLSRLSDSIVLDVNQTFCEVSGVDRDMIVDRDATYLNAWRSPEQHDKLIERLASEGRIENVEIEFLRPDGELVVTLMSAELVTLGGEQCVIWQGADITKRKRLAGGVELARDRLAKLVDQRTEALDRSTQELIDARRLATIGTFAAGVAHQINNPLGAILNAAQYALLCEKEDDALDIFRAAAQNNVEHAKRAGRIVRALLQFSRGPSSEKQLENLIGTIETACRLCGDYARERQSTIELDIDEKWIPVLMNSTEIEQVMVNLIRNAIESRDLGVAVVVAVRRRKDVAEIAVVDDGPGIPEADHERAFEPFYTTRLSDGGTGLGLSVAHGVVAEHKGEIRLERDREGGTAVIVELPVVPD